ncbi:hypothetical protein K501DRAFT_335170 [Backusella circina FSU 941]|nr:hypothetical protein K501DRAFT_335170 [Backusella circina FSU 941]
MGSPTKHPSQLISRRLDFNRGIFTSSATTNTTRSTETAVTGMDYQHTEIEAHPHATTGPLRLLLEYHNNDSSVARPEDSRLTEEHSNSTQNTSPISNICNNASSTLHSTFITNEESDGTLDSRLGHEASVDNGMHQGTALVATQLATMEREEYPSPNTTTYNFCRRKQHGLGLQPQSTESTSINSIWLLDSPRSSNVNQLERTEGSLPCVTNFSSLTEHASINQNGQHNLNVVHQQTRRNTIIDVDDISHHSMEMVPEARDKYPVEPCTRRIESDSRFRVQTTIPEEQLDDATINISTNATLLGTKRRRSFCRSEYDTTKKVRIVASGSWQLRDGCFHPVLEAIPISISQSSVEFNHPLSPEIATRETTSSGYDNIILENSPLFSGPTNSEFRATYSTGPSDINSTSFTYSHMANRCKQELEARRVEILNTQCRHTTLNQEAQQILTQRTLSDNSTNRSYQRGQLLFLDWASGHNISDTDFSPIDLINFLSTMKSTYDYAITTLQLIRSAYLSRLNDASTSLASLQGKLAFLLGVACFFRPSDLQRIPFTSVSMSSDLNSLSLEVHCPKEKRRGRRIIKTFQVCAHTQLTALCPIQTFLAYRECRPQCSSVPLLVNSIFPEKALQASTIQGWISRLLRKSTSEPRVSIRSIASSLALASGIPKEDVITMGDWSNSAIFENHYRREHLSLFDFISTLITLD